MWFRSACFGWFASLALPDKRSSGNWDLFHITPSLASQSPPEKLSNQIANTPRKQPINPKAVNPTISGNPYREIIYLEQADRDWLAGSDAWKRSRSQSSECPASRCGVWVASAPLSPGLPCPAGSFIRGLSGVGVRDCVGWDCVGWDRLGLDGVAVQSELLCLGSAGSGGAQSVGPGIPVLPSQRAVLPPLLSHIHWNIRLYTFLNP